MSEEKTSLTRQLLVNTAGDGVAAALGFVTILLVAGELTVAEFGQVSVALSVMLIASQLTDLGTTRAMVRFASAELRAGRTAGASQLVRASLGLRVAISLALAAILYPAAGVVATTLFRSPALGPVLELAALGIVAVSTLATLKSVFHTHQRFVGSAVMQVVVDGGKLALVALLLLTHGLTPTAAVAVFCLAPGFGVALAAVRFKAVLFASGAAGLRRLFGFGRWAFVSAISCMALNYTGLFLLTNLAGEVEAGLFGLALNLSLGFGIVTTSLASVLLPRVSRFTEHDQYRRYLSKALKCGFFLGGSAMPFLFLAFPLIPALFGARYQESIPVFILLAVSSIFATLNVILRVTIYSLDKPHLLAFIDVASLAVMAAGSALLIPELGVVAPAVVSAGINLVAMGVLAIVVARQLTSRTAH